mgnify:FL=1|tara:strand:- start:87 stop:1082 length:996 start_codon:yes stop_codon:yes gene_type:complete
MRYNLLFPALFLIQINCSKENAQISEKNTDVNYVSNSENTNQSDESTTAEIITPLSNDISKMKSLFEAFDGVTTSSDSDYFYISSNGIPSHNMMEGITNWQQQFPINQEYNGTNSWSIPINPEFSENPLSSESNFMKGAMAIAINGIPIFNALNNRGEDANLIGELDKWGGHCGKADDYHYHLPPTHLSDIVGADNPIAYSLDGFPLFGKTNDALDENLGLLNKDGSYSYFTVESFPYFISKMKGKITTSGLAPENQIIPQAQSKGIRPALTPLKGAEITKFLTTGENSYQLIYSLNNQEYTIEYLWDNTGHYFVTFTDPDGTFRTETYHK